METTTCQNPRQKSNKTLCALQYSANFPHLNIGYHPIICSRQVPVLPKPIGMAIERNEPNSSQRGDASYYARHFFFFFHHLTILSILVPRRDGFVIFGNQIIVLSFSPVTTSKFIIEHWVSTLAARDSRRIFMPSHALCMHSEDRIIPLDRPQTLPNASKRMYPPAIDSNDSKPTRSDLQL